MKKMNLLLAVLTLCLSTAALAAPTYTSMMTWNRGDAGSTYQDWTFDDADNPAAPESTNNPGATATFSEFPVYPQSVSLGWQSTVSGRSGVWQGDALMVDLFIPNFQTPNPVKTIWFEMDYQAVSMSKPTVTVDSGYRVEKIYEDLGAQVDGWRTMVFGWKIYPNPNYESIRFGLAGTGGFVDRISVDTMCSPVPAPGAILLAGMGIAGAGYLKRRNRSM